MPVTGYGQPEDRQRSALAGFDQHLVKTVEPDVLEVLLRPVSTRSERRAGTGDSAASIDTAGIVRES